MTRVWLAIAIAACGGGQHPDELRESCRQAADHDAALARESLANMLDGISHAPSTGEQDRMVGVVHDLVLVRCVEDRWSVEMRRCLLRATDVATVQACNPLLTPEQTENLIKAGNLVHKKLRGSGAATTPEDLQLLQQ